MVAEGIGGDVLLLVLVMVGLRGTVEEMGGVMGGWEAVVAHVGELVVEGAVAVEVVVMVVVVVGGVVAGEGEGGAEAGADHDCCV